MYFLPGVFIMYLSCFLCLPCHFSLLSSVLSYLHSSGRWMWLSQTPALSAGGWNFPWLQKVPSAACAASGGTVTALAVMWGAMACMPGSSTQPACDQVILVCAESQVYWRSLEKMEIHCTSLRKNLVVSMVILSWPNPWQCVLKAEVCKNLKLAERMNFLRLSWIKALYS